MRGMYLLVSVQQGTGQILYPFSKFILRIYIQLIEVRFSFFFLRQLDWKQTEYKFIHGSISNLNTHICELDLLAYIMTVMSIF